MFERVATIRPGSAVLAALTAILGKVGVFEVKVIVLAVLFLGEPLTTKVVIGGVLVVVLAT